MDAANEVQCPRSEMCSPNFSGLPRGDESIAPVCPYASGRLPYPRRALKAQRAYQLVINAEVIVSASIVHVSGRVEQDTRSRNSPRPGSGAQALRPNSDTVEFLLNYDTRPRILQLWIGSFRYIQK
jgi:hypothetical protein